MPVFPRLRVHWTSRRHSETDDCRAVNDLFNRRGQSRCRILNASLGLRCDRDLSRHNTTAADQRGAHLRPADVSGRSIIRRYVLRYHHLDVISCSTRYLPQAQSARLGGSYRFAVIFGIVARCIPDHFAGVFNVPEPPPIV